LSQLPHPLTLSFDDPSLEREFWIAFARSRRRYLQTGVVLLGILYAAFGIVDANLFGDQIRTLVIVRYGFAMPLMLLAWPLVLLERYRELSERRVQEILLWLGVVATCGILAMGGLTMSHANLQQTMVGTLGFFITLTFIYGFTQLRFAYSAALGVITTLSGFAYLLWFVSAPSFVWIAVITLGVAVNAAGFWVARSMELLVRQDFVQKRAIEAEHARSERLLANALPVEIARRLLEDEADLGAERAALAERHDAVTVLVADIAGFTPLAERMPEGDLAQMLDRLFSVYDALAAEHGVEKVKTLGDAWVGAAGAPTARADHADRAARLALAMLRAVEGLRSELASPVDVRIGVHSGPAVAGVIGRTRFAYDLWGDAVDGAKAMEQAGAPGRVRLSEQTAALLSPGVGTVQREGAAVWLADA
jgi:adenylate cyclase